MKVIFFSNASFILNSDGILGTGNWATSLIKAILAYLNDIEVYYGYHDSKVESIEVLKIEERLTVIKIPTDGSKTKFGKLLDNWLVKDLYRSGLKNYLSIIEQVRPDIIQIFGLETPFIRLIGNVRVPIVIHLQGVLSPYLFKYYSRFTSLQLIWNVRFKSLIKGETTIQEKLLIKRQIRLEESIYSECKYFLGRTEWDRLVAKVIAPQAKYYYCQEIMREAFYKFQWAPSTNDTLRIFTTISGAFYKNADILFEVVNLIEESNSRIHFIWNVAGIDETNTIVRLMRKKGYRSKRIRLLGKLGANDLIKNMLLSDLFVLPSAIENSPNALQEAMLLGMPIISTHAGGVSSLIDHGVTGILVSEGEPYSLTGAIIESNQSAEKMAKMGYQARIVAMKRNDPRRVVNSLLAAYKDILASNSKGENCK